MSRGTRSGSKDSREMVGFSKEEIDTLVQDTVDAAIRNTTTLFNQKLRDLQERHDKEMEELRGQLTEEKEEVIKLRAQIRETTLTANELEQYSRRSHIRIHGLSLTAGTDCKGAVAAFIRQRVKDRQGRSLEVNADDFDAAHPLPLRRANPPVEHQAAPKERIPAIITRCISFVVKLRHADLKRHYHFEVTSAIIACRVNDLQRYGSVLCPGYN
ncbi:hypothetical protein CAPTEDRAFT_202730 [Capitella teleta]|uniref:Uncharacterized protein n=3 Tax=Capitella teleta TaxID=283909 RepID=R7UV73_CAPTE|nr:hypothetical protein CAPTEDRAFT_202730 [Capitella teleta]|eukprot:ELU10538.1 hypothetical protein CAPTEDRAFT_202730 [Capitella teleta]